MRRRVAIILVVVIIAVVTALVVMSNGRSKEEASVTRDYTADVAASLKRLLQRSTATDDCFVIVKETSSGKVVQFAGSVDEPLLLVLAGQTLTAEEHARAAVLLGSLGAAPDGEQGFTVDFGRDVSAAARAATRIFSEVYQLREIDLSISEK